MRSAGRRAVVFVLTRLRCTTAGLGALTDVQDRRLTAAAVRELRHSPAYWFGTQSSIDAGEVAVLPDAGAAFHHGTDVLQV